MVWVVLMMSTWILTDTDGALEEVITDADIFQINGPMIFASADDCEQALIELVVSDKSMFEGEKPRLERINGVTYVDFKDNLMSSEVREKVSLRCVGVPSIDLY